MGLGLRVQGLGLGAYDLGEERSSGPVTNVGNESQDGLESRPRAAWDFEDLVVGEELST